MTLLEALMGMIDTDGWVHRSARAAGRLAVSSLFGTSTLTELFPPCARPGAAKRRPASKKWLEEQEVVHPTTSEVGGWDCPPNMHTFHVPLVEDYVLTCPLVNPS